MRKLALIASLFLATMLPAQFSSIQIASLHSFGSGPGVNAIGIGSSLMFPRSDRLMLVLNVNAHFFGRSRITDSVHAQSSLTVPMVREVEVLKKIMAVSGTLEFHYYVTGDTASPKGIYGIGGLGLVLIGFETKSISNYSKDLYNAPEVAKDVGFNGIGPVIGMGYEKKLGNRIFFVASGRLIVPLLLRSSPELNYAKLPLFVTLQAGLRLPLGGPRHTRYPY